MAEVVTRFAGFVARYMGDGILIYFGYPHAHEDDAERAAQCALAVLEAVSSLKLAEELCARIGIATGTVVVGGGAQPIRALARETGETTVREVKSRCDGLKSWTYSVITHAVRS